MYDAAVARGEAVPAAAYQPRSSSTAAPQAPRTKQQLVDVLKHTNSALSKAKADVVEKDRCVLKATKRAKGWKFVVEKERSEKKALMKSKVFAETQLLFAQKDLSEEKYYKSLAIVDAPTAA